MDLSTKMKIQSVIQSTLGYSPSLNMIEYRAKYTRFDTEKKGHANGFFKVYDYKGQWVVLCGDWAQGGTKYVLREEGGASVHELTKEERRELHDSLRRQREEEERVKSEALEIMRNRYTDLPFMDSLDFPFPYLTRKGLSRSYIGKYDKEKDSLVFPIYDYRGHLVGLQDIDAQGNKRISRGSTKKGSFALLRRSSDDTGKIYACEGFATGISIFEATGATVIICIDAGNLELGIDSGCLYLNTDPKNVIIVADNDESGTGEKEARKACSSLGCSFILIPYENMDANDYAQEYGKEFLSCLLTEGVNAWDTGFIIDDLDRAQPEEEESSNED